jgi:hypothetical protein
MPGFFMPTSLQTPPLTELAVFVSQALNFFLHRHVVGLVEFARQGVHLLSDQLFH